MIRAPTVLLTLSLVSPLQLNCRTTDRAPPLAPPPTAGNLISSRYEPEKPYAEYRPGAFARVTYHTTATGLAVDVYDFLIAPQKLVDLTVAGATVYEAREGQGIAIVDGKAQEITAGAVFAASEHGTVKVENRGNWPMVLRAHVFKIGGIR